jgi:membrane protease YdiL (CAAX protease family)
MWCRIDASAMERHPAERITPIIILLTVYGLVWIDLFLPQPAIHLFSTAWFALSAAKSFVRLAILALVMRLWLGFEAFRLGTLGSSCAGIMPKAADMANGMLIAAAAGAFALFLSLTAYLTGAQNPLLYSFSTSSRGALTILLMVVSSIGIGYTEELFFRFFAVTAFEKAGFATSAAILASALIFGASHGSQGFFGMVGTAMVALLFSFFVMKGKSLHALALGHALYDFVILLAIT